MLRYNGEVVELNHFPDGTLHLVIPPYISKGFADNADCVEWHYESEEELVALIYLVNQLREDSPKRSIHLHLPYIPNARMDRIDPDDDGRTVFTLKHFARIINSLNFEGVFVLDPHSNVSTALLDRVILDGHLDHIEEAISRFSPDLLYFPDEGSCKRYASSFEMPYACGVKRRDWNTGEILGLDVISNGNEIAGKKILIVDDICSRGGTFYHSAKKLKELGAASVSLYVTHCENTILSGNLLEGDLVEKVYTTDSILTKSHPKIEVFNL